MTKDKGKYQKNNKGGKSRGKSLGIQRQKRLQKRMKTGLFVLVILFLLVLAVKLFCPSLLTRSYFELDGEEIDASKPEIDVELLTVNPYSRPGIETGKINGIVIHYTANPGSTAMENRNYFEGLKDSHATKTSSNFVVGLDGEIVQCVPTWEVAYASNDRNKDTVSIECCHPDESGRFTDETYRSVVQLSAWLCLKFGLDENDIIRHYDVTGKNCPKYFVENEEAWQQFKEDVKNALESKKS